MAYTGKAPLVQRIAEELLAANQRTATNAQDMWTDASELVFRKVKRLRPSTLGIVAASGKGGQVRGVTLYEVHCGTYLNKYDDGRKLLEMLAATAIIARMTEIVCERYPQASRAPRAFAHIA